MLKGTDIKKGFLRARYKVATSLLNINEQHVVRLASAMAPPTEDIGRWEETVAIHEAGHAVTAMALPHISVSYINILRETTAVNYGNSKQELGDAIISLLAGGEAVKMSKRTRHMTTGDGQDLHLAEIYARTLLIVEGHNQSAPDFERSIRIRIRIIPPECLIHRVAVTALEKAGISAVICFLREKTPEKIMRKKSMLSRWR